MANSLSNTLAFEDQDVLPIQRRAVAKRTEKRVDFRPRLTAILQTTLDVPELLDLFFKEARCLVTSTSCHYEFTGANISISCGERGSHSCCYRLLTKDDYLGEISFTRKTPFTKDEIITLEDATATLIYPIRNALRYQEAVKSALTDPLTSAGNRIAFETSLQRELDLASRYDSPLSMLVIDIDHFKLVNDNYGHHAGDSVLKSLVREIKQITRCADMTFRYGGEEFVVLLNKTSAAGARIIAERLRAAIAGLACVVNHVEIPITVSIGCSTWRCLESKEQFFKRTDEALYEAKAQGRNMVVTSEVLEVKQQTRH